MTISNDSRARIKKVFEPVALRMGRLGLTPDALTLIGFVITVVGAVLISQQFWLAGGVVVLLGGVFDMFDGTLARATGKVSNLGAFMDSVFDRAGEAIVFVGVAFGCLSAEFDVGAFLAATAMAAAFMVSYTRAKSESLGFTAGVGMAAVGLAPREVRIVILTVGLLIAGWFGGVAPDPPSALMSIPEYWTHGRAPLALSLGLITAGATITAIQRILHVRSQARHQSTEIHQEQGVRA
jgi:CDP-diacylglycerol--glycerol-3-phosphate 3-phosphatidyltransferase